MNASPPGDRVRLAEAVRAAKQSVAEEVTEAFLGRHPDWVTRYGDRARRFGIEDAGYHQDFLAGALEGGGTESFAAYARWAAGMLQARGISPVFLVENLQQIGEALQHRLPAEGHPRLNALIAAGCEAAVTPAGDGEPEVLAGTLHVLLEALLQGARRPALLVVQDALRAGGTILEVYQLIEKAMREIGRRWQQNQISVAQEHTATAITQYVLAQLYEQLPRPDEIRGRALITGVAGELHQTGANMVADALETDGWDVRFLGTNMPVDGIVDTAVAHRAAVVGISATMLFNLKEVRRLVEQLRARMSVAPRIVVGGAAFRYAPEFARELRLDGAAFDVRAALDLFRKIPAPDSPAA